MSDYMEMREIAERIRAHREHVQYRGRVILVGLLAFAVTLLIRCPK